MVEHHMTGTTLHLQHQLWTEQNLR